MANGGLSLEQIEAIRERMRMRQPGSSDPNAPINTEGMPPVYSPPLPVPKPKPKPKPRQGESKIQKQGKTKGKWIR